MSLKICNIGCGGISNGCHGPSYVKYRRENPDFITAASCDLDAGRAAAFAKKFGFARHYTDYIEMLRVEKPDAVCVTVDENHIAEVGLQVINMGFPIFMEKPPGKNSDETRALIDAATKKGVINQVGYNRRHMPILQKLRELISVYGAAGGAVGGVAGNAAGGVVSGLANGAAGGVVSGLASGAANSAAGGVASGKASGVALDCLQHIRYDFYRVARYDEDFSDTAVHGIDAVRYLTGADYARVNFTYQALPQYGKNVMNIYMDCIMSTGVHALLSFCPVTGAVLERATVSAKDNTWVANTPIWAEGYDRPGELIHIYKNAAKAVYTTAELIGGGGMGGGGVGPGGASGGGASENVDGAVNDVYITNGFYNENKAFFDCVRKGQKCGCDLESALNTSLVKDCITNRRENFALNG